MTAPRAVRDQAQPRKPLTRFVGSNQLSAPRQDNGFMPLQFTSNSYSAS